MQKNMHSRRLSVGWLHCLALGMVLGTLGLPANAKAGALSEVIDLVAENTELSIDSIDSSFVSAGRVDGRITVVNGTGSLPTIYRVYELDPSTGSSNRTAVIDPMVTDPSVTRALAIPTPTGEVYFVLEDFDLFVQQNLYRLDSGILSLVLDLTAQGIEIPMDSATTQLWTGGSLDGIVRIAYGVPTDQRGYQIVEIDPSTPSAAIVSDFQTNSDFATLTAAFDPGGTVYFVISEMAVNPGDPRSEGLFRVDGNTLVAVADVAASGFELAAGGMVSFSATATSQGIVNLLTRRDFDAYYSLFEIDPAKGTTSFRSSVRPASVFETPGQPGGFGASEPVSGIDGTSYFVIGDAFTMTPRQGLYRHDVASTATRVVDITAQGLTIGTSGGTVSVDAGVDRSAMMRALLPHPSSGELRLLYRFDAPAGLAFGPLIVDLTDTGPNPSVALPAFGPGGQVYYIVSDGQESPQQGVWRLDGAVLTQVVDITDEGLELSLQSFPSPSVGVIDDGSIQLVEPHPSVPDVFRLFRFDPSDGSATMLADLDYAQVASSPHSFRAEAFGPSGELFVILGDAAFPSQQNVYRRQGASLVGVSDLSAQGIELADFSMNRPVTTATAEGIVRVVDDGAGSMGILRIHAIDTSTGLATIQASIDEQVLCCSSFGGSNLPVFGTEDDLYLLGLGETTSMNPQQAVYRMTLPEPSVVLLQAPALFALALVARRRRPVQAA